MATPSEWYTSLQQGGAPVSAPTDRRGGGRGGKFNDFLSKQRKLRHAIAKEELRQLKTRGAADRWEDAARRRTPTQTGQTTWQRGPRGPARGRGPQGPSGATAAKALLNMSGRMGPMPFQAKDLGTWLDYIGPGRAHQGLMQTGRLLSGGSVGPDAPEEEKSPYSRVVGLPGGTGRWPGGAISGGGLPTREKGGTIPKTGPYKLHEGEIVVSADQVDRPLMAALKADKLNKMYSGQMDGKGTGPGPPTAKSMVKDEFEGGTLHGYQEGSFEPFQKSFEGLNWGDFMTMLKEGLFPGGGNPQFEDPLLDAKNITPEGTSAQLEEELGDASLARPELGSNFADESEAYAERYKGLEESGGLQSFDQPDEEAQAMDALLALGSDPLTDQQERDRLGGVANEATFARAAAGDRGLGEEGPLTLQRSGPTQRTSYEPGDRADPAVREREKREFNATMNQMKADRLHDYLMKSGPDLDPETFKAIQGQAKQLQAINKAEKDRQTVIDENAKDRITEMEKAVSQYMGQLARAEAAGDAGKNVGLRQEKQHLREKFSRYELKFWEEAEGGASRETMEQMANALIDIEAALEGINPGDPGYDEWRDANMGYRMGILQE